MQVNPKIFKAYDVRGLAQTEIIPELAYAMGRGFTQLFLQDAKERTVVVGEDARPSSPGLAQELIRGLRDGGADVVFMGRATTPLFYFAVNACNAKGGIMVTASHNPAKDNGFKVVRERASAIGLESGLGALRDLIIKGEFGPVAGESSFREQDFREAYIEFITRGADIRPFNIAVDAGNGMAGIVLPQILGKLGITAQSLYLEPDGTFPNHEANPLKEETLADLKKLMASRAFDFGIAFDGDADRIGFLLSNGTVVRGDIILALLAKVYASKFPGFPILYAVNCSRIVPETIEAYGGKPVRWKVGHTLQKAKMLEVGGILGGEMSTHYFYKEMHNGESAMLTLVRICEVLTQTGKTLAEVLQPFMKYAKTPEINFAVGDKEARMKEIAEAYKDAEQDWLDGLTVAYRDWWFNIRPSNTESLLRLNLEADTKELMERKLDEVAGLIRSSGA